MRTVAPTEASGTSSTRRRTGLLAAALTAATLLGPSLAHAEPLCGSACHTIALHSSPITQPAGIHPVGRIDTQLSGPRPIMVSLWYPTPEPGTTTYVPATDPAAEYQLAATAAAWMHTPDAWQAMIGATIPARENAAIDTSLGRLPVTLISPGLGTPRWNLSGLAMDLASRGRIVITIDHTSESPAVELPGGRIMVGADTHPDNDDYMAGRLTERLADTSLVLDRLPALPTGPVMDLDRITMAGHSYGGTTAVGMLTDPRVRAAVSIDGPATWNTPTPATNKPMLFVNLTGAWTESWTGTHADTVTIPSAGHYSSTDLCAFGAGPDLCGTIDANQATTESRGLIETWLDAF